MNNDLLFVFPVFLLCVINESTLSSINKVSFCSKSSCASNVLS